MTDWFTWDYWGGDKSEIVRNLGLVIAALVGLPLLIWRAHAADKSAKASEKQATVAEQGHITERFTRAIDQLGSEELEVRLGAIYALERIAQDSPRDHWPIMETLTAYVRTRASRPPGLDPIELKPVTTDIQAVLTVLGRRRVEHEPGHQRLDLTLSDLGGATLARGNLNRAKLTLANLVHANLESADLESAAFRGANLKGADLEGANLKGANLKGAQGVTCHQLIQALHWETAYRDKELACGAPIPTEPEQTPENRR